MPGGHHPCGTIQNRPEIVALSQLGLAGRQPHPHRQLQLPLRGHRRIHRRSRRRERSAHAVPGVLEQPAAVPLDRPVQYLVMGGEGDPHLVRVGFPPTGRTLNVGEQKRHDTRRSGHLSRMSHQHCFHTSQEQPSQQIMESTKSVRRAGSTENRAGFRSAIDFHLGQDPSQQLARGIGWQLATNTTSRGTL